MTELTNKLEEVEEEEEDSFDKVMRESGCADAHYDLLDCMEAGDWRKCQDKVKAFKDCFEAHKKSQSTD
eukprot:CFRG5190T1